MESKRNEVLEIIRNAEEITQELYEFLVNSYGNKLVDLLIEQEINDNELDKYTYYLDMKLSDFANYYNGAYQIYINDIKRCKKFDNDDNKKYLTELSNVINQSNMIFSMYEFMDNLSSIGFLDGVDLFLSLCEEKSDLIKIKKLSLQYIELRNKLVEGNLNLVLSIARTYFDITDDRLELIQAGNDGLIKSIDKYDLNKDAKFSSYACYWIKNGIFRVLKSKNTVFSAPGYILDYNSVRLKTVEELKKELNREPSDLEVATRMNISLKKYKTIKFPFEEVLSLEELKELEYDDCDNMCEDDLIDSQMDLFKMYIDEEVGIKILNRIKKYLTEVEYYVLTKRYGLEENEVETYKSIGVSLGMSRSNVVLVEKRAFKKIRKKCSDLAIYLH